MSVANVSLNATSVRTSDLVLAGRAGSSTLTANVNLDIAVPSIVASDVVLITPIGTLATAVSVVSITPGTGFRVISAAGDTRPFNWCVVSTV